VERIGVSHWLVRSGIVNCDDHRDLPARPNNTHERRLLGHLPLSESDCSSRLFTILQIMIFVTFDASNSGLTSTNISSLTHHSYLNWCVYITVGNICQTDLLSCEDRSEVRSSLTTVLNCKSLIGLVLSSQFVRDRKDFFTSTHTTSGLVQKVTSSNLVLNFKGRFL
jgi:hypothetical protein